MTTPHPEQALPNVVATAPERIYLVIGEGCPPEADFTDCDEVAWSKDQIDANSIEYVRADVVAALTPQAAPAPQPEAATAEQSSVVGVAAALADEDVWTAIDRFAAQASYFHGHTEVIALDDLRNVLPEAASHPLVDPTERSDQSVQRAADALEELKRALSAIRVVAGYDGKDCILRESVIDIVSQRLATLAGHKEQQP